MQGVLLKQLLPAQIGCRDRVSLSRILPCCHREYLRVPRTLCKAGKLA